MHGGGILNYATLHVTDTTVCFNTPNDCEEWSYQKEAARPCTSVKVKGALGQLNCWDKDANLLFDAYDVTGDGQLSYDEFSAVLHVKEALQ